MKVLIFFILSLTLVAESASAQRVIKFDALKQIMETKDDTIRVINFWATWCQPCVKEFPEFQRVAEELASKKVKVIFVSLDFKKDLRKSLKPFLALHHVMNECYLLDETDYNSWIDKVDTSWEGNLPATLIISKGSKQFYPKDFTYEDLNSLIRHFIESETSLNSQTH